MSLFLTIRLKDDDINVSLIGVAQVMRDYGNQVDSRARAVLEREGKNSTGFLSESIRHEVSLEGENIVITWPSLAPYADFVERGVKGAKSSFLAPNSPYQFGSGSGPAGGLKPAIRKWIDDKPIKQWRDLTTGRFMSYESMSRLISRKVYLQGIAPTPFLRPSMREVFDLYKARLEDAFAGDVSFAVGRWMKKQTETLNKKIKI